MMLQALCNGTTDPQLLAELARGKLRKKLPQLREALEGRFEREHGLVVSAILAHLDFLDGQIEQLSQMIAEQLRPFAAAIQLLRSIPGVEQQTAEVIVAEIGTDMSQFPSDRHLASWAGQCSAATNRPANAAPAAPAKARNGSARVTVQVPWRGR